MKCWIREGNRSEKSKISTRKGGGEYAFNYRSQLLGGVLLNKKEKRKKEKGLRLHEVHREDPTCAKLSKGQTEL